MDKKVSFRLREMDYQRLQHIASLNGVGIGDVIHGLNNFALSAVCIADPKIKKILQDLITKAFKRIQ